MNNRLNNLYSLIEKENREKFLGNQIEIDKNWGKKIFGITLQIDLSQRLKQIIYTLQQQLISLEPENLFLPYSQTQHLSFNQVVHWGNCPPENNRTIWESIKDDFISRFCLMDSDFKPFEVFFNRIIPTIGGIIWCAEDTDDKLESLRNELLERLPFPKTHLVRNHIIHTTIVRYRNNLKDPIKMFEYLQTIRNSVPMCIDKIFLRKELVYPSISIKEIAHIDAVGDIN
jgi:hypothetical protein